LPRRPGRRRHHSEFFSVGMVLPPSRRRRRRPASTDFAELTELHPQTPRATAPKRQPAFQDRRMIEESRQNFKPPRWRSTETLAAAAGAARRAACACTRSGLPRPGGPTRKLMFRRRWRNLRARHDTIDSLRLTLPAGAAEPCGGGASSTAWCMASNDCVDAIADPAQRTAKLHRLTRRWPRPQFNFLQRATPGKIRQRVLISVIGGGAVAADRPEQDRDALRAESAGLRLRWFCLYPRGPIRRTRGAANAHLCARTKQGRSSRGGWPTCSRGRAHSWGAARKQGDGRGRLGAVEKTAAPGLCSSRRRGGLPWARCVPDGQEATRRFRKGMAIRCLVLSERPDYLTDGALSDAGFPGLRLWVGE